MSRVGTSPAYVPESVAPGELESIRTLLNTWEIPNDTRRPVDLLPQMLTDRSAWEAALPHLRFPATDAERRALTALRATLRAGLGDAADVLNEAITKHRWRLTVQADGTDVTVRHSTEPPTVTGDALAIIVQAITTGTWTRLRACPDCQWVFYDTSRNGQRTWCSMTAAAGARGCGSIAKTRAYRERRKSRERVNRADG